MKWFKYINLRDLLKALALFSGSIYVVFLTSQQIHFLISETNSSLQHYFLHMPKIKPKINNYTVVWSEWSDSLVIKKIVGVEGDLIWYDQNNQMFINDFKIGVPKKIASDGRKLHAIPSQIIPKSQVFLYSENINSFDSRYQELGLVSFTALQGLVIPLV